MSLAVDLVKEAGPYVLGLAGIYATYRSGASHGREARHHARVEKLYQEMLATASDEYGAALRAAGLDLPEMTAPRKMDDRRRSELETRIDLFASPNVADAWGNISDQLNNFWMLEHLHLELTDLILPYRRVHDQLVEQMRIDLGVLRTGARRSQLRRFGNRRTERRAVQRHRVEQQRADPPS